MVEHQLVIVIILVSAVLPKVNTSEQGGITVPTEQVVSEAHGDLSK